jgi:transposase
MTGCKWRISDELWEKMVPLIPQHKTNHQLGTHHKRVDNRADMDAILFSLRTGSMTKSPLSGTKKQAVILRTEGNKE